MRRAWFERNSVSLAVLAVFLAAGAACVIWWVPIAARWHIHRLPSDSETTRLSARAALADLGPRVVPTLARFTDHSNRRIRLGVAQVLGDLNTPEALKVLAPMVRDQSEDVRREAAWVLLAHREHLRECGLDLEIDHPDPVVRLCAIALTGQGGLASSVDRLIGALEDSDNLVRQAAAQRLRALTGRSFAFDAFAEEGPRREAVKRWRAWWQAERQRLPADRAEFLAPPSRLS